MADSLLTRLQNEMVQVGYFSREAVLPAAQTPQPDIDSLVKSVTALKRIVDASEGNTGSVLDKGLSLRDLVDANIVQLQVGATRLGGNDRALSSYQNPPVSLVGVDPFLDIPPTPTALTATGTIRTVFLGWQLIAFRNFAYVEIWRATTNSLGAAVQIAQTLDKIYVDAGIAPSTTYYYWVRAVGTGADGSSVLGAFNAIGGTPGGALLVGGVDLGPLSVTADKLSQGTYPNINLVPNPGAEDGLVAWQKLPIEVIGAGGTFGLDTTDRAGGTQSFSLTKAATADGFGVTCYAFPVIPGETYSFKVKLKGSSAGSGVYFRIQNAAVKPASNFLDSGSRTSFTDFLSNATAPTTWTPYEFTYAIPAGIYWASIAVYNYGGPLTTLLFDDVQVGRQITASFLAAGSIAVGSAVIQNGAIVNALIGNLAVDDAKIVNLDGAKINAASITATKIVAHSLTATQLAANTITANEILAGTITGNEIAANTVTAGKIDARGLSIKDASGNVILAAGSSLDWSTRFPPGFTTQMPAANASADITLTNLANTTIIGNAVVKTSGSSGLWDTAARSLESFTGGAAALGMAAQTNADCMFGLTTSSSFTSYTALNYCVYLHGSGYVYLFELGVNVGGPLATYSTTDKFVVQYDGQFVRYFQNNTLIRQTTASPNLVFYWGSAHSIANSRVNNAGIAPVTASSALALVNNGGMTLIGNTAFKSGNTSNVWDAGFFSKFSYAGGAAVSFSPVGTSDHFMLGLNTATDLSSNDYTGLDYSIYCAVGTYYVYESNTTGGALGTYAAGDVFHVVYDNANVRYFLNGSLFRTVAAAAGLRLYADSSFYTLNGAGAKDIAFGPYGNPSAVSPTNQITSGNISTYIASAAIGTAQVGVLTAGNLTVTALSNTINGSAGSGQRIEVAANVIRVYDSGGVIRVKLGDLS